MEYHYVMTLTAIMPYGGRQISTDTDTVEVGEGDTEEEVFWDAFSTACKRIGVASDAAHVLFWSLRPNQLG